jgi:hypothetical protein
VHEVPPDLAVTGRNALLSTAAVEALRVKDESGDITLNLTGTGRCTNLPPKDTDMRFKDHSSGVNKDCLFPPSTPGFSSVATSAMPDIWGRRGCGDECALAEHYTVSACHG